MLSNDFIHLTTSSLIAHKLRSFLTMLGISVGIAAVVLLTSIGEGVHHYVLSEFTQFGSNLVSVTPGKATTTGMSMGVLGSTRPLSIEDVSALKRLSFVKSAVGFVQGNAAVKGNKRSRRTLVLGSSAGFPNAFKIRVASGRFLPEDDPTAPRAFTVLGHKVKKELFGDQNPLGEIVHIGGSRFRVIGVMESKGQILGFDMDDAVYIPLARALELFNRVGIHEIDILYREGSDIKQVVNGIHKLMETRHGRVDFTITTQQQMLDVLSSILNVITFAVGAIGGISLLVGGIGIITIMTISVSERQSEIGLLRALGGKHSQILLLFLGEAVILSAAGGVFGLLSGTGIAQLLHLILPALPVHTPWSFVVTAELVAVSIGLIAGVVPARNAAKLDPIEALRDE